MYIKSDSKSKSHRFHRKRILSSLQILTGIANPLQHALGKMKMSVLFFTVLLFVFRTKSQTIRCMDQKSISSIRLPLRGVYWAYMWYQPAIKIFNCCAPSFAVRAYTPGAGLRISGALNGQCSSDLKQTYAAHKNSPSSQVPENFKPIIFPRARFLRGALLPDIAMIGKKRSRRSARIEPQLAVLCLDIVVVCTLSLTGAGRTRRCCM